VRILQLEQPKRALESGDSKVARKAAEFIEGEMRVLDGDAGHTGTSGPIIQIGFEVGWDK
jgi:hypothetical protein